MIGDIKAAIEFANDPTFLGGAAFAAGIVPGGGDIAGKILGKMDNPAVAKAFDGIKDFLGEGKVRAFSHRGNVRVVSEDGQRRVRLEFSEKSGKQISPHAHVERKTVVGGKAKWVPVDPAKDHINFRE